MAKTEKKTENRGNYYTCNECGSRKFCQSRYENDYSKMVRCTDFTKG